jgi:hypothetical protein
MSTTPSVSYTQYLQWAVAHLRDLPAILSHAQALYLATTWDDRGEALRALIDLIVPMLRDFPVAAVSAMQARGLEHQVAAQGIGIAELQRLWPIFEALLPVLLRLIVRS